MLTVAEVDVALARLRAAARAGASDPKSPWALAHGLIAYGPELEASDGRSVIDVFSSYAERDAAGVHFSPRRGDDLVEPHPNLLAKTLVELGVPLDTRVAGSPLRDVARAAWSRFHAPSTDSEWQESAWTLALIADLARRDPELVPPAGAPTVATLAAAALLRLEKDSALVTAWTGPPERAFDEGTPLRRAKEQKTGIFGHGCGGLHFVQAVLALSPASDGDQRRRVRAQLDALITRAAMERAATAELLRSHPGAALLVRVQRLKFSGHLAETLGLARDLAWWSDGDPADGRYAAALAAAATDVIDVLAELDHEQVYEHLAGVRREREQTYLDLIGDACHAVRGLTRARQSIAK